MVFFLAPRYSYLVPVFDRSGLSRESVGMEYLMIDAAMPGTYLLLLECDRSTAFRAGKLGTLTAKPGFYLYVGSAFGPGGLRARIAHHARISPRAHWHVDYLRAVTRPVKAWCCNGARLVHRWAQALMRWQDAAVPFRGFGSSDCRCPAHLFYFLKRPARTMLEDVLDSRLIELDFSPGATGLKALDQD